LLPPSLVEDVLIGLVGFSEGMGNLFPEKTQALAEEEEEEEEEEGLRWGLSSGGGFIRR
jgi:hypothetical protein